MDQPLKQRLIGAAVLAALAVIFLPMLLKGPDVRTPDAEEVPLTMPAAPGTDFETRELPLTVPEPAPRGAVLGMDGKPRPVEGPAGSPPATPDDTTVPDDAVGALAPDAPAAAPTATAVPPPPAAAPAPAPAPAPVGAGGGDFVVAIGVFADVANAQALAAKLRAAGLPVRADAVPVAGKDGLRLRVGPYADRAAAEAGRLRAQAATNVAGKVIALDGVALPPAPEPAPAKPAAPVAKPVATTAAPATLATTPAVAAKTPPKPAASVPAPATASPPSSGGAPATVSAGFAVQLSAPAAESDANALRDKARAAGFPSFVQRIESESGTRYRVRIGPFADRAAADAARDAANGKLGTHGIVMRHP